MNLRWPLVSYSEAIPACNSALRIAPDDIAALNNKGIALQSLGDLQARLSEFEVAKLSYSKAIAAYNSALIIAPDEHPSLLSTTKGLRCEVWVICKQG